MATAAGAIGAMKARARRKVISHFLSHNAVSPDHAIAFHTDRRLEQRFFERMTDDGIVVAAKNSTYWVDVPKLDAYLQARQKRVKFTLAGVVAIVAAGVGLGLIG